MILIRMEQRESNKCKIEVKLLKREILKDKNEQLRKKQKREKEIEKVKVKLSRWKVKKRVEILCRASLRKESQS